MSDEMAQIKLEAILEELCEEGLTEEEAYDYIRNYVRNFYQYYPKEMEEDANARIAVD
tara:strand:- start:185 stop:358 length:174 start_codon:yes stop_codon:yes gene_type:complete